MLLKQPQLMHGLVKEVLYHLVDRHLLLYTVGSLMVRSEVSQYMVLRMLIILLLLTAGESFRYVVHLQKVSVWNIVVLDYSRNSLVLLNLLLGIQMRSKYSSPLLELDLRSRQIIILEQDYYIPSLEQQNLEHLVMI